MENTSCSNLDNGNMLIEVIVKIGLQRIDIQERVIVEMLLDSSVIKLVISSEFTRKWRFKRKKIERPIYIRNINSFFDKKRSIKYMIEVNIYYQ